MLVATFRRSGTARRAAIRRALRRPSIDPRLEARWAPRMPERIRRNVSLLRRSRRRAIGSPEPGPPCRWTGNPARAESSAETAPDPPPRGRPGSAVPGELLDHLPELTDFLAQGPHLLEDLLHPLVVPLDAERRRGAEGARLRDLEPRRLDAEPAARLRHPRHDEGVGLLLRERDGEVLLLLAAPHLHLDLLPRLAGGDRLSDLDPRLAV